MDELNKIINDGVQWNIAYSQRSGYARLGKAAGNYGSKFYNEKLTNLRLLAVDTSLSFLPAFQIFLCETWRTLGQ